MNLSPPEEGLLHLVVLGKEIGSCNFDLTAKYPKA
tara:strand:- start:7 stop:111 length:105 start_codon:yes stop_codon:yes gene_type:complete